MIMPWSSNLLSFLIFLTVLNCSTHPDSGQSDQEPAFILGEAMEEVYKRVQLMYSQGYISDLNMPSGCCSYEDFMEAEKDSNYDSYSVWDIFFNKSEKGFDQLSVAFQGDSISRIVSVWDQSVFSRWPSAGDPAIEPGDDPHSAFKNLSHLQRNGSIPNFISFRLSNKIISKPFDKKMLMSGTPDNRDQATWVLPITKVGNTRNQMSGGIEEYLLWFEDGKLVRVDKRRSN